MTRAVAARPPRTAPAPRSPRLARAAVHPIIRGAAREPAGAGECGGHVPDACRAVKPDPIVAAGDAQLEYLVPALAVFFWILNAFFDAVGQLSFKAAAHTGAEGAGRAYWLALVRRPWLWVGIVCFGAEFVVWLAFLSLVPLSEGVLLGTVNVVILMLAGRLLFRERLTHWRVAGMALVALGVALVGLG